MTEHAVRVYDKLARVLELDEARRALLEKRRAYFHASLALHRGKRAFFGLDAPAALEYMRQANLYFRSWKLGLVCTLLRVAPRLLLAAYRLRDRLFLKASTEY